MTNRETIEYRKKWVGKYKVSVGCSRCGRADIKNPSALCFDHLDKSNKHEAVKNGYSKRPSAGGMFRLYDKKYPVEVLINEIKKCQVLCQVCHMELTHPNYDITSGESVSTIEELEQKLLLE